MPTKKRRSKKKLTGNGRLNDAKKWLSTHSHENLVSAYSNRYGISADLAETELMQLGFNDQLFIQHYEKEGIEWEYRVEPTSGEMVVVPKETEEHEIYDIHGLF